MQTRCLAFHAPYRCRHRGECCRAGWDIDVEPHVVAEVRRRRLAPREGGAPFRPAADGGGLSPSRTATGDCMFHVGCRCGLQAAGGEPLLPSACRHFPRVYLRDARGALVTLSHYCPTAAALLFDDGPVGIVAAAPPLALSEPVDGLDARDALPPLLRPGMLTDVAGYGAWESAVIAAFVEAPDAESAFQAVERATRDIRKWAPGGTALSSVVTHAFAEAVFEEACSRPLSEPFTLARQLTGPHPLMEVPNDFDATWPAARDAAGGRLRGPVARYLAACAFGNWIAYRGQGLRSVVAWLRACYDVLRVQLVREYERAGRRLDAPAILEAFRHADYVMVHTVDSLAFGRAAVVFETGDDA